jgi:hypothetical protein
MNHNSPRSACAWIFCNRLRIDSNQLQQSLMRSRVFGKQMLAVHALQAADLGSVPTVVFFDTVRLISASWHTSACKSTRDPAGLGTWVHPPPVGLHLTCHTIQSSVYMFDLTRSKSCFYKPSCTFPWLTTAQTQPHASVPGSQHSYKCIKQRSKNEAILDGCCNLHTTETQLSHHY